MQPDDPLRDAATLLDIWNAARLVQQFVHGIDRRSFALDSKTHSAVILQIAILGEATKRLSRSFREANSTIPWTEIAGMRDVLIHGYDGWDLDEVWSAATTDIPLLVTAIEPLIPHES